MTKVSHAFAFFLLTIYDHIDKDSFIYLVNYMIVYIQSLNTKEWINKPQCENEFSVEHDCDNVLEISNELVTEYLPAFYQTEKEKNLNESDNDMEKYIQTSIYFSNWLYNNNFTDSKL